MWPHLSPDLLGKGNNFDDESDGSDYGGGCDFDHDGGGENDPLGAGAQRGQCLSGVQARHPNLANEILITVLSKSWQTQADDNNMVENPFNGKSSRQIYCLHLNNRRNFSIKINSINKRNAACNIINY